MEGSGESSRHRSEVTDRSWDNKHPADKPQGEQQREQQADRQVSRCRVWIRPLKRFHQRAVGARRELTATGRSEEASGGQVVRASLPSSQCTLH